MINRIHIRLRRDGSSNLLLGTTAFNFWRLYFFKRMINRIHIRLRRDGSSNLLPGTRSSIFGGFIFLKE
jgi:hypothetical protein